MKLSDLLCRLRSDMNGIPLEDIPDNLSAYVSNLVTLDLAHVQDDTVLKPYPKFFLCPNQLEAKHQFPLAVFEACGHAETAKTMVTSGQARLVDNPFVGMMVVVD